MPSKKTIELQDFSKDDLLNELAETETQYQKMKFDHATKGLENPLVLREVRRDIARLKTEVRRREVIEMSEDQLAKRSRIRARRRIKS
ncbi:MAG: 50S ribosomal protein L29 [Saprospiraceae bacterium]|nr:50S ribosomal protein L29 [Saprospiraceae bacterium]